MFETTPIAAPERPVSQSDSAIERRSPPELFRAAIRVISVHWPEYCIEAALLGLFMVSACIFTALIELPSSIIRTSVSSALLRRMLIGSAMGLTAMSLIYSPLGQRSGAHINPSITLTFLRLGRIKPIDAALYVVSQLIGGVLGVIFASHLLGTRVVSAAEVRYAATQPGVYGLAAAIAGEFVIAFLLMTTVLHVSNNARLSRYTGLFAGLLVAVYITFEAPLSGMSMNPARTLASAIPSGIWHAVWIYLIVPPLAMLSAAELYTRRKTFRAIACCKLYHNPIRRCIFCGANGGFQ
jgi:aquaporin Z